MNRKNIYIGAMVTSLLAAFVMGTSTMVFAHGGATGIVKERMEMMKSLADSMKLLKGMMQNKATYDANKVREAAKVIKSHASEKMTKLFPKGSGHKPSEALPAVWSDWDKFKELADKLSTYADTLEAAAGNASGPGQSAMMKDGGGMMKGNPMMQGGGMMGGAMQDPEALKSMPPMASFMKISQTCSSCHTDFRLKKKEK